MPLRSRLWAGMMVPPYKSLGGGPPKGVETNAPLSDWKILKRFNSEDRCETQRQIEESSDG
jgi:hypothetical protein